MEQGGVATNAGPRIADLYVRPSSPVPCVARFARPRFTSHDRHALHGALQDEISLSVISFLERHAGITDVQYFERPPCASRDIENWERAHYPCVLPEDFKSFLRLSDGLLLKWSIKQGELTQPLGCMQVNDIANLLPCPRGCSAPGKGVFATVGEEPPECVAAFELDSNALDGRLALLYRVGALTKPQVWFQDLSTTWFFIAHTFTDYFRLMMMHLGNHAIPGSVIRTINPVLLEPRLHYVASARCDRFFGLQPT